MVQHLRRGRLLEHRAKPAPAGPGIGLEVQHHRLPAAAQQVHDQRADHRLQLCRAADVVVEDLHLIAIQAHQPDVLGDQHRPLLLGQGAGDRALAGAGLAAEEVEGGCRQHRDDSLQSRIASQCIVRNIANKDEHL
ncbi:hypothetical protein WG898_21460 [Paucibacter sp. AS307]|uniref:hypothetical protein n=1 Tax=Paucibacter soli TaxID=3133433 RepID=UPI0030AE07AC